MSLNKYTPDKEEKNKRCCLGSGIDIIALLLVIALVYCPHSCKKADELRAKTEKIKKENESRP